MALPPDSGIDLTTYTPPRSIARADGFYATVPMRARPRFWRRGDGNPFFSYSPVEFDGSVNKSSRGGNLTGLSAPVTKFTIAARVRFGSFAATNSVLVASNSGSFTMNVNTSGNVNVTAQNAAATAGWSGKRVATSVSVGAQVLLHAAGDLATGIKCWLNGALTLSEDSVQVGSLDWDALTNWRVGSSAGGTAAFLTGELDFLWFDTDQCVNDPGAFLGDLGSDGAGTGLLQPKIFMSGNAAYWNAGLNGGSGGAFTPSGTFVDP